MEGVDICALELSAIIDVPTLRVLLDYLHKITKMSLAILDLKGNILISIGWQDICARFHRVNPQTEQSCIESDLFLAKHVRPGEFVTYKCKNQLWDMLTPLCVGDTHVGNIYVGQFFYDDETINEAAFMQQAQQYGFDQESYLDALRRVPRFSRGAVNDMMSFVTKLAGLVSDMSFSKLRLEGALLEQQRTTAALQSSYDLLYNTMRDAFVSVDMEGHIRDFNQYILSMLGYAPEEIRTLTYQDLTPEKWHAMEAAIVAQQVLPRGYSDIYEKEYRRKDGEVFPVELRTVLLKDRAGNPSGMWAIVRDISERKRAEERLRESDARYLNLLQQIRIGIVIHAPDGSIQFSNEEASHMLGLTLAQMQGKEVIDPAWRFVREDGSPMPFEEYPVNRVLSSLQPFSQYLVGVQRPGIDDLLWGLVSAYPEFGPGQELQHIVVTFVGITERKKAEEERRKLEERLQQSYKMEAIGALAGGIAHDFNNILSSVLGFAELAKIKFDAQKDIKRELDEIFKAGIRARDLVKQILTFSRQSGIKREPMLLVPLIKEALKFLRASLPATIEIRQDLPDSNSMVLADPTQMHQVVMNLCANAAYAMKEGGGVLDVRLTPVDLSDPAEFDAKELKPGRYLRLSISDTGTGIPKDILSRIFDPFFTTKGRGEGTGMGLAVVHGIVRGMDGSISVASDPGKGATFHIVLPRYEGAEAQTHAPDTSLRKGSGRILFVDDEEGVIASGRGILEQLGYTVVATTSPLKAVELFAADPGTFDLVLTDLTMPGMTGLELAERLHAIRPAVPIVLSTGLSLGVTPEKLSQAGIREMVMKPLAASELSQAVFKAFHPA